jgi:hypothetical protein
MSGAQQSGFANVLYDPLMAGKQQAQTNQLQMQQLDLTAADHEQVGRLAAGLLNEPDPAKRADLYARGVGMLQSQGLAKYAPPTLPDESTLRSLVSQTIPAQTQAEWLQNLTANRAYTNASNTASTAAPGSTTGAAPPTTTPPGTPGAGATIGQRQNNPGNLTFAGQPGASPGQGNRFAAFPDMPTGVAATANQLALYQEQHGINTVRGAVTRWVSDPNADLTSYTADVAKALGVGPDDPIDLTNPDVQAKFIQAQFPHESAGGGFVLNPADVAKGVQMAAANRGRAVQAPGTAIASAAPATAQPGQPVPTQVAGPPMVSTAPPGSTAAPVAPTLPPAQTDTTQPPAPTAAAPAPATAQPPQPGVRQPPQPPQPPPAAPLPPPPQMPVLNANGLTDIQQRQVNALAANPQNKQPAVAAAQQAFVNQNIQLRQQAFSDYMQQQQLAVQQGTLSNAQAELNLKTWQAAHPVPTSPRPIQGTASWDAEAKQWVPATPGQPAVQGVWAYNNQGRGEFQPAAGVPAQGAYENMKTAYSGDVPTIKAISESGRTAQASALQLNELADVIKGVQSGGILPEFRAKVAALMEANGAKPETIQAMTGMSSGSDAQVLQKLAVATIGASAKSDLGSNVGVESLNLYAGANPGLDKLQDANKRVTNMIRVAREQIDSYSLGAQQHFNQNQTNMLHTPQGQVPDYHPLSEYNEKWQAQNNPQIGAAAIGILNGDGFDKWAARAAPEEALNAVRLAARIDPNVQIPVRGGGFKSAQDVLSHGAGR